MSPTNLPQSAYQHLPVMSSAIPANHFFFITNLVSVANCYSSISFASLTSLYPTTTATGQPQQPTISSALTLQMPSTMPTTTHLNTAETLDQPLNTPSPSIYSTITATCTAELSSYLPIYVDNSDWLPYTVLQRELVAMSKDEKVMESILSQLLGQDPPGY